MSKQIKLIWDFRGPDAQGIAEHYKIHLDQYLERNQLSSDLVKTGIEEITGMYYLAYMAIDEESAEEVIKALRPHRREIT